MPSLVPGHRAPRLAGLTPLALAAALLVASCGGGGGDAVESASAGALTLGAASAGTAVDAAADTGAATAAATLLARACAARVNDTAEELTKCVTLAGVRRHQAVLQAIADANGGNRAAGTPGYDRSVQYVVRRMRAAGYEVTLNEFPFTFVPLPLLRQTAPVDASYDSGAFTGSATGEVSAAVTAVDINLTPPRANTSGCEATDFAAFPVGNVALVQRGGCPFVAKALNAQAAGAAAVIIFNQGDTPEREALIVGTLAPETAAIPVVGASFGDGSALAAPGATVQIRVEPPREVTQVNVVAESRWGDPDRVVMAGAHLDSVQRGPGINDNGSGSAALLETAIQMARVQTRQKLRFAWWGAEESGLLGSNAYVAGLADEERSKIALYLNFDMVGSPNHVFFIYDGDDSDGVGAGPGPAGSAEIEQVFERFFAARGVPFKGTDFSGRSDYGAFIANGIPAGGLFTGAEGVKTAEEAAIWGGTAGEAYDPCYHQRCDTFANNNRRALDVNSDAIADAVLHFAMNDISTANARRRASGFVMPPVVEDDHHGNARR